MWENETKQVQREAEQETKGKQELYPAPARRSTRTAARGEESLLLVQCALCTVAVLFVLLVRTINVDAFETVRTQLDTIMNTGIATGQEPEIVRFVSRAVQQARAAASSWVEGLHPAQEPPVFSQGSGGFWPIKNKKVPSGASLEPYMLPETLHQPVAAGVTSAFGFRKNPVTRRSDFHAGVDLGAAAGTPVSAVLGGQVVEAGTDAARGNYIVLHHRAGLQSLYQHLACGLVRVGETIQPGQSIGTVGSTGLSTGPHLHLELIVNSVRVDPLVALGGN